MSEVYPSIDSVFEANLAAMRQTHEACRDDVARVAELIIDTPGKLVLTGVGKSGRVAELLSATLASTGQPAVFMHATEAMHGDFGLLESDDMVLMISNSAATPELFPLVPIVKNKGLPCIGLFGRDDTPLAAKMDYLIRISIHQEGGPVDLVPMSSCTASLAAGHALTAALMRQRNFTTEDFAINHPGGNLGRQLCLRVKDVMQTGDRLPQVTPDASFKDVLVEMTQRNLGAVCVCEQQTILGIISDGDIRRALLKGISDDTHAEDIMTPSPVTVSEDQLLADVLTLMENPDRRIYVIPVAGPHNEYIGMIRMHDILS